MTSIFFTFKLSVHTFNGYSVEIDGFGVVKADKPLPLSEATVLASISLGNLLRRIVITNGYTITNGKLVKVQELPEKLEQKV